MAGKKLSKYYIAQVTKVVTKEVVAVKYLRRKEAKLLFTYPAVPDVDEVDISHIKDILPKPKIQRGRHIFKFNFEKYAKHLDWALISLVIFASNYEC